MGNMTKGSELVSKTPSPLNQVYFENYSNDMLEKIVEQIFIQLFGQAGLNLNNFMHSMIRSFDTSGRLFSLFVIWQIGVLQSWVVKDDMIENFWKQMHEKMAKNIWSNIIELRGFWVKLGQFFSTRYDILPEQYIRILSRLQDNIPGDSPEFIYGVLKSKFGDLSDVFSKFNYDSMASASVAQVHEARILNGDRVVVKILHNNVENTLLYDNLMFENLGWFFSMTHAGASLLETLQEWQKNIALEIDFSNELRNMELALDYLSESPFDIVIPKPYKQYSSKNVLVMEFIDGIKINDFERIAKENINTHDCLMELLEYFLYQMLIVGMFHADPHPGNLMYVKRDGKWKCGLIDWGYVKTFSPKECYTLASVGVDILEENSVGAVDDYINLGAVIESPENMDKSLRRKFSDPNLILDCLTALITGFSTSDGNNSNNDSVEEINANKSLSNSQKKYSFSKDQANKRRFLDKNIVKKNPICLVLWSRTISLLKNILLTSSKTIPFISVMIHWCKLRLRSQHLPNKPFYLPNTSLEFILHRTLNSLIQSKIIIGCQISIRYDAKRYGFSKGTLHEQVVGGSRGLYDLRSVDFETLFNIYSASKCFVSASILKAAHLGLIDLDSPVSNYWPQFGHRITSKMHRYRLIRCDKRARFRLITIRDVLNHKIGGDQLTSVPVLYDIMNYDHMCEIIANAASWSKNVANYSHITFGYILSKVLFSATGEYHEHYINSLNIDGIKFYTKRDKYGSSTRNGLLNISEFFYKSSESSPLNSGRATSDLIGDKLNFAGRAEIESSQSVGTVLTGFRNFEGIQSMVKSYQTGGPAPNENGSASNLKQFNPTLLANFTSRASDSATDDFGSWDGSSSSSYSQNVSKIQEIQNMYEEDIDSSVIQLSNEDLIAMTGGCVDMEYIEKLHFDLDKPLLLDSQINTSLDSLPVFDSNGSPETIDKAGANIGVPTGKYCDSLAFTDNNGNFGVCDSDRDIETFYENVTRTDFKSIDVQNYDDMFTEIIINKNMLTRPERPKGVKKTLTCIDCANGIYNFIDCLQNRCLMMDPRMFDYPHTSQLFVPGLNCHASASALSEFYLRLPEIISDVYIDEILDSKKEKITQSVYKYKYSGFSSSWWSLGFQIYDFRQLDTGKIVYGLGHSDISGTHGMYIPELCISIAITVNNISTGSFGADILISTIAKHFGLEPLWLSDQSRLNTVASIASAKF